MANWKRVIKKGKKEKNEAEKCIDAISRQIKPEALFIIYDEKLHCIEDPSEELIELAKEMSKKRGVYLRGLGGGF